MRHESARASLVSHHKPERDAAVEEMSHEAFCPQHTIAILILSFIADILLSSCQKCNMQW